MPPALISAVRQGRGRHVQPHRNRFRLFYPTECKREICRISDEFQIRGKPLQLKVWERLHYKISLSTLHGILRRRAQWMESESLERCRLNYKRRGYDIHEKEMLAWCHGWVRRHGTLTYACLMEKAKKKAEELELDDFKGSNGWACNFVRRHGLKMRRRCGEGGDANEASAELARHAIPRVLMELGARPQEVLNCDETGIIFGAHPERTLAPTSVKGTKRDMDRLTLLLCCNVTGDERLKPLMCGKMQFQRAWRARRDRQAWCPDQYVRWEKTPKAWMNKELFNRWLTEIRADFKASGKRIFLIMDNCSSHRVLQLEDTHMNVSMMHDIHVIQIDNMWCIMLPPNATALIQPLDQGIIALVKARYRAWFLRWLIDLDHRATARWNLNRPPLPEVSDPEDEVLDITEETPLHRIKPSYRRGIRHVARIWNGVQPRHITNCWRRSGIVPEEWTATLAAEEGVLEQEFQVLQPLIEQVHPSRVNRLNACEFVHDVLGEMEREAVNSAKSNLTGQCLEKLVPPTESTETPSVRRMKMTKPSILVPSLKTGRFSYDRAVINS